MRTAWTYLRAARAPSVNVRHHVGRSNGRQEKAKPHRTLKKASKTSGRECRKRHDGTTPSLYLLSATSPNTGTAVMSPRTRRWPAEPTARVSTILTFTSAALKRRPNRWGLETERERGLNRTLCFRVHRRKNGCVLKQTEVRTARRGCRRSAHGAGQEYLRRSTYTSNKGEEHMHVRCPDALARVSQNTDGVHP